MGSGDEQLRQRGQSPRGPPRPRDPSRQRVAELERKIGQQELELDFFKEALRRVEELRWDEQRTWRNCVYALSQAMTQQLAELTVERMCALAQVSRAGYYRHWQTGGTAHGRERGGALKVFSCEFSEGLPPTHVSRANRRHRSACSRNHCTDPDIRHTRPAAATKKYPRLILRQDNTALLGNSLAPWGFD
jgi:hypothetical protein